MLTCKQFVSIWTPDIRFNEVVRLIDNLGWLTFGSSLIEIRPFAFEVALEERAIHVFVDKLDLVLAYTDSNGNKDLSTAECDAYLRWALILFQLDCNDHRTMDSDTVRLMH